MKSDSRKVQAPVSETRKIRKPLMEKKRRARINDSLETLKQILLDSKAALKETTSKKAGQRTAKLEKADILEMTVHYIQNLKRKLDSTTPKPNFQKEESLIRPADSTCNRVNVGITLVPTRLGNGELAFVIPPVVQEVSQQKLEVCENVWRPW